MNATNTNLETTMNANELETTVGRAEAIAQFVAECEVTINQLSPELAYRKADLDGFVRGCWPCDGTPADVASDFVAGLNA